VLKPREQLEFEERVRRRRVEEWRAGLVAAGSGGKGGTGGKPRPGDGGGGGGGEDDPLGLQGASGAVARRAAALLDACEEPSPPPATGNAWRGDGGGGAVGSGPTGVVAALRALRLGEGDVLVGAPGGAGGPQGAGGAIALHQLYSECKVRVCVCVCVCVCVGGALAIFSRFQRHSEARSCWFRVASARTISRSFQHFARPKQVCAACYEVYKDLDGARRSAEERSAADAKKQKLRQKLVREQVEQQGQNPHIFRNP